MAFQIGSWVRFKPVSPVRLGYALTDIGQVVGLYDVQGGDNDIDVEFGDGQIVHGADGDWFESAEPPAVETLSFHKSAKAPPMASVL